VVDELEHQVDEGLDVGVHAACEKQRARQQRVGRSAFDGTCAREGTSHHHKALKLNGRDTGFYASNPPPHLLACSLRYHIPSYLRPCDRSSSATHCRNCSPPFLLPLLCSTHSPQTCKPFVGTALARASERASALVVDEAVALSAPGGVPAIPQMLASVVSGVVAAPAGEGAAAPDVPGDSPARPGDDAALGSRPGDARAPTATLAVGTARGGVTGLSSAGIGAALVVPGGEADGGVGAAASRGEPEAGGEGIAPPATTAVASESVPLRSISLTRSHTCLNAGVELT